jgi:hypothetical protein
METILIIGYLSTTGYITVYVGGALFQNGRPFLLDMLREEHTTDAVNRILLAGYYLVNLGYVSYVLTMHAPVRTPAELVATLAFSIGRITMTLGIMHWLNITAAILWNKFHFQHKL